MSTGEPLPNIGSIKKPDSSAALPATINTGRRPKRSPAIAASGVATAMNSTATHNISRNCGRGMCSVVTP